MQLKLKWKQTLSQSENLIKTLHRGTCILGVIPNARHKTDVFKLEAEVNSQAKILCPGCE